MRLSKINNIFKKEVIDTLRDRRTLLIMIVVPMLLYPGLMIFINELATSQQAKMEKKIVMVALVGIPDGSPLFNRLHAETRIQLVSTNKPFDDVREGEIHFVLEMPSDVDQILQQKKTASVQLHYDRSNDDAVTNLDRVRKIVEAYRDDLLKGRLQEKALSEEYVKPLDIKEVNVASKQKMGGFIIGRFLPMLMVIMVLAGSMYPAIDMTAGEKERGTLETILTSPATRTEIVLGKFLTVTLIALITGLLNLGSMMGTFAFGIFSRAASEIQIKIPLEYLLIMIGCLIPLAVFFSGMMMAVSCFARSFKEAQNLLTPIYLIATMPAMVSIIPGIQLEGFWMTLPIANVTLLFKELMLGVFDINHILVVFFSVAFLASVSIFAAVKLFGREEVLFGEASSFGLTFKRANILPKGLPEPSEALFFSMISLALLLYVGIPLQLRNVFSGLVMTELLIFLLFPVAFAAYLKLDFRRTFRLRTPSISSILLTMFMFVGIELSIGTILYLQNWVFPIPKELIDMMEKMMKASREYPFPAAMAVIALLPAVCEETTFRGVIFSGMISRTKPATAIIVTAALFAVFHLSLHRFLGVFLIGLAATFVVWKSGSIFTGMLLHLLNNGFATLVVNYPQFDFLGATETRPSVLSFVAGVAILFFSIYLFSTGAKRADQQ